MFDDYLAQAIIDELRRTAARESLAREARKIRQPAGPRVRRNGPGYFVRKALEGFHQ